MYSKELEKFIEAALADGVVTEKERAVLIKKATELGIDLDEFEMILDARIHNVTASVTSAAVEQEKSNSSVNKKEGIVKKCPSCGGSVESFQEKCNECDHVFRYDSLNTLNENIEKNIETRISQISSHTIPLNRESLIEFLSFSIGNAKNKGLSFEERSAWNSKFTEAYNKAKFSFKSKEDVKILKTFDLDRTRVDFDLSMTDKEKEDAEQERKDLAKNPLLYFALGISALMLYWIYKLIAN